MVIVTATSRPARGTRRSRRVLGIVRMGLTGQVGWARGWRVGR